MTTTLAVPTVHLNGTGATSLKAQYEAAYRAVVAAREAIAGIETHGRDYYVQADPDAYQKARGQHLWRIQQLGHIEDELHALYQAIEQQER